MKKGIIYISSVVSLFLFACNKKEYGKVTDIDGNEYITVLIGDQWWMAENLKVTRYRSGDSIPNIIDAFSWLNTISGGWSNFDNDVVNDVTYGKLYNWYAVNDPRGLCPEGWHIPTDEEWLDVELFYGMSMSDHYLGTNRGDEIGLADKFKAEGFGSGANNESGFAALGGGLRGSASGFDHLGLYAGFWTSTRYTDTTYALHRGFYDSDHGVSRYYYKWQVGFSCRCVQD